MKMWKKMWNGTQPFDEIKGYDDKQVVSWFLDIHRNWWDKSNSLWGKRELAEVALLKYLKDGTEPDSKPTVNSADMIYVVGKFAAEVMPHLSRA